MTSRDGPWKEVKLNLGSNTFKIPGWLDVDIVKEFKPDFCEDVETLPSFSNRSVDEIYAGHILEHVPDPFRTLRRWKQVLKPGGRLTVTVPNLGVTHELWREGKDFPVLGVGPLSGLLAVCTGFYSIADWKKQVEENPEKAVAQIHKRVFDQSTLTGILDAVGYTHIKETDETKCLPAPKFTERVIWQMMFTCVRP